MPSRRCPHCRVVSSYDIGGERRLFDRHTGSHLRFDTCRNEECQSSVAVVIETGTDAVVDIFPSLETEPDELLPDDVRIAFRQALQSLNEKIWDGCVTMSGRALQEAMNDLKAEGDTLYAQIEYLAGQNKITPDLKDWAHEGRLGRNLGAHGSRKKQDKKWSDEADAQEIVEFCKWFFRSVYVLPEQLRQRRERLAEGAKLAEEAAAEEEA